MDAIITKKNMIDNIEGEFGNFARSFKRYREDGWSNIIDMYGAFGGIVLIKQLIESRKVPFSQNVISKSQEFLQWADKFFEDYHSKITDHLEEQFNFFVIAKYKFFISDKKILETSEDYDEFVFFREMVELFFIGIERYLDATKLRELISHYDQDIKDYIYREILPRAFDVWIASRISNPNIDSEQKRRWLDNWLNSNNIDFLPAQFWWRHL